MSEIEIKRYQTSLKKEWDEFVESSKNGTFLFNRDYMDYHSDRFQDNSYLFYRKGKLYCLLPANRKDDVLYSHQGLTYGGLIMNDKCTAEGILKVFDILLNKLKEIGIKNFYYKPTPYIYHKIPSEEDIYALFRHNAHLIKRNISSTIFQPQKLNFSKLRKRMIRKSVSCGIDVHQTYDLKSFWEILKNNLEHKYNVSPVHSLEEISYLASKFRSNIILIGAFEKGEMLAGVLCYISSKVIHSQYISAKETGKKQGALDAIFNYLMENYNQHSYFDFGISTEDGGKYLNESLIQQKEGFGGRGICYDEWELSL